MVLVTIAREFTSTVYGNLSPGKKVEMSRDRYEAWLKLGYVEEMKETPLGKMTKAQLIEYAKEQYGVDLDARKGNAKLIEEIKALN